MPRYTVDLSDEAARVIEAEVSAGRQASAEAFIEELLTAEVTRREGQDLFERLIDESFDSGPSIPVTEEFWEERRRKLYAAVEARRTEVLQGPAFRPVPTA